MAEVVYRAQLIHGGERDVSSVLLSFPDGARLVFGRGRAPFYLDDPLISVEHFALRRGDDGLLTLLDLGSMNGTVLNQRRLSGGTSHPIGTGDVICFGDSALRLGDSFVPTRDGELLGRQIDGISIEEVIGRGRLSVVYRGTLLEWSQQVAIKTLRVEQVTKSRRSTRRFLNAARLGWTLRHPNIAAVYRSGHVEELGLYYVVMEYIDGEALDELIKARGPLTCDEALTLIRQIGDALVHAHDRRVLHRDVNPSNVLVGEQLRWAKLVGLGLAKSLGTDVAQQLTMSRVGMGQIAFIPPEQLRDAARADERSDVYSLAATLYYALAGRSPLGSTGRAADYETLIDSGHAVPDVREHAAAVPERIARALARALAFDPERRQRTMRELMSDLERRETTRLLRRRFSDMMGASCDLRGLAAKLEVEVLFSPAGDVGGDFYDFIPQGDDRVVVVLGDVMGHGPEAAIVVGLLLGVAGSVVRASTDLEPTESLQQIHTQLRTRMGGAFAAVFLGVIDLETRCMQFCSGGQPPLVLYNRSRAEPLTYHQPPSQVVGISFLERLVLRQTLLSLREGDLILLRTDGIVEAPGSEGAEYGDRIAGVLERYEPEQPLSHLVQQIGDDLHGWRGRATQDDDMTLIALRIK